WRRFAAYTPPSRDVGPRESHAMAAAPGTPSAGPAGCDPSSLAFATDERVRTKSTPYREAYRPRRTNPMPMSGLGESYAASTRPSLGLGKLSTARQLWRAALAYRGHSTHQAAPS